MPRRQRTAKAQRPVADADAPLTPDLRDLLSGRDNRDAINARFFAEPRRYTDELLEAVWTAHRAELLAAHRERWPLFSRPWPFFAFDYPDEPPDEELGMWWTRPEVVTRVLRRLGELTAEEQKALRMKVMPRR